MNLLCIALVLVGFISQIVLSQDATWCIGDAFNVTWNDKAKELAADNKVNIVLKYGIYGNTTWTLLSNQDNNGFATVNPDLSDSIQQLFIANDTDGAFWVEGTKNGSILAENVTLCQSIIFGVPGRATPLGLHMDGIIVSLRQSTYMEMGGDKAQWKAEFVSVDDEKNTWKSAVSLDIRVTAPTAAPTVEPTVKPTQATTTTAKPTSNSPRRLVTQFFSTETSNGQNINNNNENDDNSISLSDALRQLSLGSIDNEEIELPDCSEGSPGWCQVNLTVEVPHGDDNMGGPYELVIGVLNTTASSSSDLQYYGVNTDDDSSSLTTMFFTYNASGVDISFVLPEGSNTNTNETIYKYADVGMSIELGTQELNENIQVYVVATRKVGRDEERLYLLECGMEHLASYYTKFGWRTLSTDEPRDESDFPAGPYSFDLYWAVDDDYENVLNSNDVEYYTLGTDIFDFHVFNSKNGSVQDAVSVKSNLFTHGTKKIEFETSFNGGIVFTGYVFQCNNSYINDTTVCKEDHNSTFNFTTENDGTKEVEILFSDYLERSKKGDNESTTFLNVTTMLCGTDGFETPLTSTIQLFYGSSSSKNNSGLSAGAIVGIVCAGVLVLGLAAWWLCMKKSGGDGYRELNE